MEIPTTLLLVLIAEKFTNLLWALFRRKVILGGAIVGFSVGGLGMIIGSSALTGWWQAALLGLGTSLLLVGTVELGIIGLINKATEPTDPTFILIKHFVDDFSKWANQPGSNLPSFPMAGSVTTDSVDGNSADGNAAAQ
jgi:hypothetical protein